MMSVKSIVVSLAYAFLTVAQSSDTSLTTSVAPAAETVAPDSVANVQLFDSEIVQLTDDAISLLRSDPVTAEYASLFEFEDPKNFTTKTHPRRSLRCKTMPGDPTYPSKLVWGLFDQLLGGALEKIVPIGSVCYKNSEYNNYDTERCDHIIKNFDAEEI
jgi:hypothetical protein